MKVRAKLCEAWVEPYNEKWVTKYFVGGQQIGMLFDGTKEECQAFYDKEVGGMGAALNIHVWACHIDPDSPDEVIVLDELSMLLFDKEGGRFIRAMTKEAFEQEYDVIGTA